MKRITPPSKEELESLYPKHSTTAIAKMKGVTHTTVRKWCREYAIPMRPRGIFKGTLKNPEIDTGAIVAMTKQGLKRAEIARKLNTSVALVNFRQKQAQADDLRATIESLELKLADRDAIERQLNAARAELAAVDAAQSPALHLSPSSQIIQAKLRSSPRISNPDLKAWLRANAHTCPSDKTIQRIRTAMGLSLGSSGKPKSTDNVRTMPAKAHRTS